MIVDNYQLIRSKLDFSDSDKFYFIELMQRKMIRLFLQITEW